MSATFPGNPRIGCVKYLNARPLIHGWPGDVIFDHPARLCRQLAGGELDVALVSSFEFLRNPIYAVVDDLCVSSRGPVHSVFLAHAAELAEIEEIEIDPESRTGVNLLRCLLAESGLAPKLVARNPALQRTVTSRLARFIIGDQAIRFREQTGTTYRFWDLGDQWQKRTQLPFVYALWLIRPKVASAEAISDTLRDCRDANLRQLDSMIASQEEFDPKFCSYYFRECLAYHLGLPELEGLSRFWALCVKHGILAGESAPGLSLL